MIRFVVWVLVMVMVLPLKAQDPVKTVQTNENLYEDAGLLYRNESTGGVNIHAHGFGVNYRRGKHVTAARKRVWEIDFVSYRHPKEIKITNPFYDNAKGYYYGKQNALFILRPGFGYQNVVYSKPERNGVEIRYEAFLGVSLGLAKPVYLEILYDNPVPGTKLVITEKYDPSKHFPDNIYGRAPFARGIGELALHPGGYARLGVNFEYGPSVTELRCIEVGAVVDVYPRPIPLMANERNHWALLSLYLQFSMGKKWF